MERVLVWSASRPGEASRLVCHFYSLSVSLCLDLSRPLSHTRPVVLQQNVSLIKHSGNYLYLFKLLFMAFVWRSDTRLEA